MQVLRALIARRTKNTNLQEHSVANLGFLSSFLWSNAGFNSLRKLDLGKYDPRYDPAVVPVEADTSTAGSIDLTNPPYIASSKHPNRHFSIADYHSAFEAGTLTPLAVAEALLDLSESPEHQVAFLSVKRDQVLLAAKASTQRFKEGKAKGSFDGVPVAVKGTTLPPSSIFPRGETSNRVILRK